jgi:hypothetical protein
VPAHLHRHHHQSIAPKPQIKNKQKEIISVDDEDVVVVQPAIQSDKRLAPNSVEQLEREIRSQSAAAAAAEDDGGGDEEKEMNFEKEESPSPVQSRRQPSKKRRQKKSRKNLRNMIEGKTIQNQMKKLKKQTNEEEEEKDRRISQLTNDLDEAKSELKNFQDDQIKKDNTIYGVTVAIAEFFRSLSAAAASLSNSTITATKKTFRKLTKALEDFPIPVELKPISLKDLEAWKTQVTQSTMIIIEDHSKAEDPIEEEEEKEDEEDEEEDHGRKSQQQVTGSQSSKPSTEKGHKGIIAHRKPWDPSTQPSATRPSKLSLPKKSLKMSTLTSPTGGESFGSEKENL